jgi:hypothetical protein
VHCEALIRKTGKARHPSAHLDAAQALAVAKALVEFVEALDDRPKS